MQVLLNSFLPSAVLMLVVFLPTPMPVFVCVPAPACLWEELADLPWSLLPNVSKFTMLVEIFQNGNEVMDTTEPYKFIGFGVMDATKPYKFIGYGVMDATKPYKFIGFGANMSIHVSRPLLLLLLRWCWPSVSQLSCCCLAQ